MNDIMRLHLLNLFKSLEWSGPSIKGVSKAIKNDAKEQKSGFLSMFLGT